VHTRSTPEASQVLDTPCARKQAEGVFRLPQAKDSSVLLDLCSRCRTLDVMLDNICDSADPSA